MADIQSLPALLSKLQTSINNAAPLLPSSETVLPPKDGISLLDTKTDFFLSYLQNLVFLIIVKLQNYKADDSRSEEGRKELDTATVKQLAELRLYLEKGVRTLEGRLKYEIEKVVRAADGAKPQKNTSKATKKSSKTRARRTSDASASSVSDFEASGSSAGSGDSEVDSDEEVAKNAGPNPAFLQQEIKPADKRGTKAAEKKMGVYRPPRITPTSLPTTEELNDTVRSERKARPLRSQAVDDYISTEMADTPTAQPSIGSTITAGGRRTVTDKERRKDEERTRYEESNFIRLPGEGKKERQKRKRNERGGGGFGANEFGLGALGEMGERVGRATERAGKKRRY